MKTITLTDEQHELLFYLTGRAIESLTADVQDPDTDDEVREELTDMLRESQALEKAIYS